MACQILKCFCDLPIGLPSLPRGLPLPLKADVGLNERKDGIVAALLILALRGLRRCWSQREKGWNSGSALDLGSPRLTQMLVSTRERME